MRMPVCLVLTTVSVPWRVVENVVVLRATSEQCWKNLTLLAHVRFTIVITLNLDHIIMKSFLSIALSCHSVHAL